MANYSAANIPLDTQWMDIDYMQNYRDFTYDSSQFPQSEVSAFVNRLHTNGQQFVPIIDPGIMVYGGYPAYESGLKQDVFLKDVSGGCFLGQVWPGKVFIFYLLSTSIISLAIHAQVQPTSRISYIPPRKPIGQLNYRLSILWHRWMDSGLT